MDLSSGWCLQRVELSKSVRCFPIAALASSAGKPSCPSKSAQYRRQMWICSCKYCCECRVKWVASIRWTWPAALCWGNQLICVHDCHWHSRNPDRHALAWCQACFRELCASESAAPNSKRSSCSRTVVELAPNTSSNPWLRYDGNRRTSDWLLWIQQWTLAAALHHQTLPCVRWVWPWFASNVARSKWIQRQPVSPPSSLSTSSNISRAIRAIPMNIEPIRLAAASIAHNSDRSREPPVLEYLNKKTNIRTNQIGRWILNIPSVISTWFLKHTTHILAGFGSISVPHSQHNLEIRLSDWSYFESNITLSMGSFQQITQYLHFTIGCGIFLFNLHIWLHILHFEVVLILVANETQNNRI